MEVEAFFLQQKNGQLIDACYDERGIFFLGGGKYIPRIFYLNDGSSLIKPTSSERTEFVFGNERYLWLFSYTRAIIGLHFSF